MNNLNINENTGNLSRLKSLDNANTQETKNVNNLTRLSSGKRVVDNTNATAAAATISISQESKNISEVNNYLDESKLAIRDKLKKANGNEVIPVEDYKNLTNNLKTLTPIEGIEKGESLTSAMGQTSQGEIKKIICLNGGNCDGSGNLLCGNIGSCDGGKNGACGNSDCGDDGDYNFICGNKKGTCDGTNTFCWDKSRIKADVTNVSQQELTDVTKKIDNIQKGLEYLTRQVNNNPQSTYSSAEILKTGNYSSTAQYSRTIGITDTNDDNTNGAGENISAVGPQNQQAVTATQLSLSSNQIGQTLKLFR